jgi:hypothetical protein
MVVLPVENVLEYKLRVVTFTTLYDLLIQGEKMEKGTKRIVHNSDNNGDNT